MHEISREDLIEELVVKGKSKTDMARSFNTTVRTINARLKDFGIEIHPKNKPIDLTGRKFERLLVLSRDENDQFGHSKWKCVCDCGSVIVLNASSLLKNLTKSCGCLKRELCFKGYMDISGAYWNKTKRAAELRGFDFNLSIEEAWDIYIKQDKKCNLSGVKIFLHSNNDRPENRTASLDRINSMKGYYIDNCQWIHKSINMMKLELDDDEFIYWCNRISEYSGHLAKQEIDLSVSLRKKRKDK